MKWDNKAQETVGLILPAGSLRAGPALHQLDLTRRGEEVALIVMEPDLRALARWRPPFNFVALLLAEPDSKVVTWAIGIYSGKEVLLEHEFHATGVPDGDVGGALKLAAQQRFFHCVLMGKDGHSREVLEFENDFLEGLDEATRILPVRKPAEAVRAIRRFQKNISRHAITTELRQLAYGQVH